MIKRLSLLLLAGCMSNQGLSTLSIAQENIWNLSRISLGMSHCQVRNIMHEPYKTQCFQHEDHTYSIWFYITRPSALAQGRLLKMNVTPVVFEDGHLIGWGYDVYDCLWKKKETQDRARRREDPLEKTIDLFETSFLTENEVIEDEGCQCPVCKPRKSKLTEQDEEMIEEANDQNFNFW